MIPIPGGKQVHLAELIMILCLAKGSLIQPNFDSKNGMAENLPNVWECHIRRTNRSHDL